METIKRVEHECGRRQRPASESLVKTPIAKIARQPIAPTTMIGSRATHNVSGVPKWP